METKTATEKYNKWIITLSIAIPLVVAILFGVKLKDLGFQVAPMPFLPKIYAGINAVTAILLVSAVVAIKNGNRKRHEYLMKSAIGCSIVFLVLYVVYHMTTDSTAFGGVGMIRWVYFFILISHILLSIAVIPLVLIAYVRTLSNEFDKHKKIAKIAFPIWLYVAVTGVVVYLMISPYYVS